MSRYHVVLSDAQVREALGEYVQNHHYPHRTIGNVVYFTHDLITGSMGVEFSYPLPDPIDAYEDGDEIEYDDVDYGSEQDA